MDPLAGGCAAVRGRQPVGLQQPDQVAGVAQPAAGESAAGCRGSGAGRRDRVAGVSAPDRRGQWCR